jgi:hypothetical protein
MPTFMIQPSAYVDQIVDGMELTKLPYPYYADTEGNVANQEFWSGTVAKVVGFQKDLAKQQINLSWYQATKDPSKATGMYLITKDDKGQYSVHNTAMEFVRDMEAAEL